MKEKIMRKRYVIAVLLILLMAALISACGAKQPDTPQPQPNTPTPLIQDKTDSDGTCGDETALPAVETRSWHFVVITHGSPTSKFWAVVKNGVAQAAEDMRVQVTYQSPDTFDLDAMAKMIDDAVASHPDGIAVSIPNVDALRDPIQNAIAAGIPVVSLNSGSGVAEELGVLGHFGQSEYTAGTAAGQRMMKEGIHKGLCLIQEADNTALQVRCQGFADALNAGGLQTVNVVVEEDDPAVAQQKIAEAVEQNPTVDAILALGPSVGEPALAALQAKGLAGQTKLAAFDLSPTMLEAVEKGDMLFLVDQQPYLQGYLPVMYLTLYNENLSEPAVKITLTGPDIITKENAAKVLSYSKESLR
jgi:simple sugar transport system substrate-binding protein